MSKKILNKIKYMNAIIIILMLITKGLSFMRDLMVTSTLGASVEADAFNIAYLLAITIFGFVSTAYGNSVMPIASELYIDDKEKMQKTINNIITIMNCVAIFIIVICLIFPGIFVKALAYGVKEETFILSTRLSRIAIVSLIFLVFNGTYSILLRIYDKNIIPTLSELVFPIPILIGLFCGVKSVYVLVILIVLGYVLQSAIQAFKLYKLGYKYYPIIDLGDKQLQRIFKLMPPILVSTGLLQINTILDNQIAAGFGTGSITTLLLASKVNGLAYTVFATSLMQIIYAKLSKAYARKDIENFRKVVLQQTNMIMLFIIPAAICMIMFSKDIVSLLFVRGNFTKESGEITATILLGYSIGLIFFVLRDICNYCFYSYQNTKLPAKISIISIFVNLILNLTLPKIMGIKGISYATSIAGILSLLMLLYNMKSKMDKVKLLEVKDIFKYICSSIIMLITMVILKKVFTENIVSSIIIMIIGFIVFFISQYIFIKVND